MTTDERFNTTLSRRGGILDFSQLSAISAVTLSNEVERIRPYIQSAIDGHPGMPGIDYAIINDRRLNAFATCSPNGFFVGINLGVFEILLAIFQRIMSDPRVLPEIGEPWRERDDLETLPAVSGCAKTLKSGPGLAMPNCEIRRVYAVHLFQTALDFLVGHELTHISNGHVSWLRDRLGGLVLSEFGSDGWSEMDALDRQALEMDADCGAVCDAIWTIYTRLNDRSSLPPEITSFYEDATTALFTWAFATQSVFRLFGNARLNFGHLHTPTYPPLQLRRGWTTSTAFCYAEHKSYFEHGKAVVQASIDATILVERAFAWITGSEPVIDGIVDTGTPESNAHLELLLGHWKTRMRGLLLPYAYGNLPD